MCDSNSRTYLLMTIKRSPSSYSNQTISSLSIRTERILKPNKNVLTEIIKRSIKCLKFLAVSWREDLKKLSHLAVNSILRWEGNGGG